MWFYIFITPLFLGILVFSVFPLVYALSMSFTEWDGFTKAKFIGLGNFFRLAKDVSVGYELRNTIQYILLVVPTVIILAIILANLLNSSIKGRTIYRTLYYLPNVTMATAVATVWRYLLNSDFGIFNKIGQALGLPVMKWCSDPKLIMPAICLVAIWSSVGYATIMMLAGLQGIPKTYYEAARIDGANAWHLFFRITIPLLTPTVFFVLVTNIINGFKQFDLVFMFAGKGNVTSGSGPLIDASRTMVYGIFYRGFALFEMGYASAEALVLFALILIVTGIQFRLQKRWVFYES